LEFDGAEAGSHPATWSQREFWETITRLRPHGHYQIPWWVPVPPGHTVTSVIRVLVGVVRTHEALRTTLRREGGQLHQVIHGAGSIPIRTVEAAPGTNPVEADPALKEYLWAEPDVVTALPLRIVVVTWQGAPTGLICQCSHMMVDGYSGDLLAELTAVALGAPDGACPTPDPATFGPSQLARWEQGPNGVQTSTRSLERWRQVLAVTPSQVFPSAGPKGTAPLWRGSLSSDLVPAAESKYARRTGVNSGALFLAAAALVLADVTGTHRATFRVPSSNRYDRRLHRFVGAVSQHAVVSVGVNAPTFDGLVRTVAADLLLAHTRARYDGDALPALVAEAGGPDLTLLFNDVRPVYSRGDHAGPGTPLSQLLQRPHHPEVSWELLHEYNADITLYLRLSLTEGRTVMDVAADVSCLSRPDIERFLLATEQLLVRAAPADLALPARAFTAWS